MVVESGGREQDGNNHPISPIPEDIAAKIKSTVAINSLSDVAIGLLRNSLNANATNVNLRLTLSTGSCCCEDNGVGISKEQFAHNGVFGAASRTSRFTVEESPICFDSFLSSLSTISRATIVSRTTDGISHSIAFHHGQPKHGSNTISAQHHDALGSGTRVVINGLFEQMPVRVKQMALKVSSEKLREWVSLVDMIVALLLARNASITLTISENELQQAIKLDSRQVSKSESSADQTFRLLSQAGIVSVNSGASWVPLSATSSQMKIKGVISLDPAPTKRAQFISVEEEPLLRGVLATKVIAAVNKAFVSSRFAMAGDNVLEEDDRQWRKGHRRFKQEGHTGCKLRASRRGIEKWPRFHIRVEHCAQDINMMVGSNSSSSSSMPSVASTLINTVGRAVTEWLKTHNFRPRKWRSVKEWHKPIQILAVKKGSTLHVHEQERSRDECSKERTAFSDRGSSGHHVRSSSKYTTGIFQGDMIRWSNWKSSDGHWLKSQEQSSIRLNRRKATLLPTDYFHMQDSIAPSEHSTLEVSLETHIRTSRKHSRSLKGIRAVSAEGNSSKGCVADETVVWTDSVNGQPYSLNTRSGLIRRANRKVSSSLGRPKVLPGDRPPAQATTDKLKEIRSIPSRDDSSESLAESWDNPVFRPNDAELPSVRSRTFDSEMRSTVHISVPASRDILAPENSHCYSLDCVRVIAQVDAKFILIKYEGAQSSLALVDQHAASERVIVEDLLHALFEPFGCKLGSIVKSSSDQTPDVKCERLAKPVAVALTASEMRMCEEQVSFLTRWGIIYTTNEPGQPGVSLTPSTCIYIHTLPALVVERYASDLPLLTELIKSIIYSEQSRNSGHGDETANEKHCWLRRIRDCPQGIVEALNSRACRSAIMFNDMLDPNECVELVTRLSRCAFPSMCAHGRRSIVSLARWSPAGKDSTASGSAEFDKQLRLWMASNGGRR